jgi:hypothetical protein
MFLDEAKTALYAMIAVFLLMATCHLDKWSSYGLEQVGQTSPTAVPKK